MSYVLRGRASTLRTALPVAVRSEQLPVVVPSGL